jgi:hypothetical protein
MNASELAQIVSTSFCVPSFLDAIEFDESKPFRRNSIKPSYVIGTDDIVTTCGFGCSFSLFGKGFVSLGIGYFLNGNDNLKRRLGVSAEGGGRIGWYLLLGCHP